MEGNKNEKRDLLDLYKNQVDHMIRNNKTKDIFPLLQENMSIIKYDNDLMVVWYLGMIAQREAKGGVKSVFEKESSLQELLERYHQLKFFLRRIENDILDDADEFYTFLASRNVSEYELMGIVDSSIYDKVKAWSYLQGGNAE